MMKRILYLAILLWLPAGCSIRPPSYPNDDYGPAQPVDVSQVPDAVPQKVPKSRYGNPDSYTVRGRTYHVMQDARGFREQGLASWYGLKFHGRRTSSGEPYDMYAMTAAHKTLPLPTWVRVTNRENGKSVVVKVNDRGPFHPGRIIDLSYAAAAKLGVLAKGTAPVEIVALTPGGAPRATRPAAPGVSPEPRFIQAGAFSSLVNARSLYRRLSRVQEHPVEIRHDGDLHRVVVGPLTDNDEQQQLQRILEEWGIRPHHLVQ